MTAVGPTVHDIHGGVRSYCTGDPKKRMVRAGPRQQFTGPSYSPRRPFPAQYGAFGYFGLFTMLGTSFSLAYNLLA